MTDRLKQFIEEHREEFDNEQPGEHVLNKIQQHLPEQMPQKNRATGWFKFALAAAVLVFVAVTAFFLVNRKPATPPAVVDQERKAVDDLPELTDPVFARQFAQYKEMIGLQQTELKQLKNEYPQLYTQFVTDMNDLDSSYQALKQKLPAYPNKEMLLEAMLQNLQLQSELLNRQLLIIKEIKQKNKQYEKDKT